MSSKNYGVALYYPYIHIQDDNWLKTAALYYNEISRIVPPNFITCDNDIVNQLNEECQFIENLDPIGEAELIASDFSDFAINELSEPTKRVKILNEIGSKLPLNSTYSILIDKMAKILINTLPELGLAKKSDYNPEFLEFEPVTGALYMTCLANKMAENRAIPVVSDDPIYQPFIRNFQLDKNTAPNPDISYSFGSLIIKSAIPAEIQKVKLKNILKFRKKYDDERRSFYEKINEIANEMPNIKNEKYMEKWLEHHQKRIEKETKELKKGLKDVGIGTATGIIGLSIPTWASNLSESIPEHAPIIATVGTITIGALKIKKGLSVYRISRESSPWSYILSLERRLDLKQYMRNLLLDWI